MDKFMSKYLKSSILGSICLVFLGIMLFFQSEGTIISISYIIGGVLIAIGVMAILKFIKNINEGLKNELDIVYGAGTSILGIIVITNPKAIASIIPFIIGLIIIISSATKLQYSLELKKDNNDLWKSTMALALITLFCGILLIFNPFKGAELIAKMCGLLIFIYAVLDIISTITIKRNVKLIQNAIEEKKNNIVDAEVIEDKTNKKTSKSSKGNKKEDKKNNKKTKKKESGEDEE